MTCRRLLAALAVVALGTAACTASTTGHGTARSVTASGSSSAPSSSASGATCPQTYAAPDPNRPRVALRFTVSSDLTSVQGQEHVVFVPDRPVTELVFRLTANSPATAEEGNGVRVTAVRADHGAQAARYTRSGAQPSTQGGLLHVPFAATVPAGTVITADLSFTVTLGENAFDRLGRTGSGASRFAWFGSAQPLLAWQRGFGWHAEDLIPFVAESATSEAMDTDLAVTAPASDTVIMSGDPTAPTTSGTVRTWHAHIATARDVSVAIGPFAVTDTLVGGTRLRVGAYSAAQRDRLVPEFSRAITALAQRFGPFPFPSLSVARLPVEGGGIEYPSSILMLDASRAVAVHETAHQWFYAMVGDSQALHPWLDEAFASYAEALVNNDGSTDALGDKGTVDRSVESYGTDDQTYYYVTYAKGEAALLAARKAAGAAAWDAALRCYVNLNAWRIAEPADVAAALRRLPAAVAVLRRAGALP